jgi:hypothetical protein
MLSTLPSDTIPKRTLMRARPAHPAPPKVTEFKRQHKLDLASGLGNRHLISDIPSEQAWLDARESVD